MADAKQKKPKAPKAQPFGIQTVDLRDDGKRLLIVVNLDGAVKASKNGKMNLFAATPSPVRITHPRIPALTLSMKVGSRISNVEPELQLLLDQRRAVKEKIKQYREQRKQQKAAKK